MFLQNIENDKFRPLTVRIRVIFFVFSLFSLFFFFQLHSLKSDQITIGVCTYCAQKAMKH